MRCWCWTPCGAAAPPAPSTCWSRRVADVQAWSPEQRQDFLADLHQAEPSRALIFARALGVLPARVLVLGCEPAETEEAIIGLSEPVERAADAGGRAGARPARHARRGFGPTDGSLKCVKWSHACVLRVDGRRAEVDYDGRSTWVDVQAIDDLQPGEYVAVYAGAALERLPKELALELLSYGQELERLLEEAALADGTLHPGRGPAIVTRATRSNSRSCRSAAPCSLRLAR